ncbi:MAG: DNA polymerase III subunit delta [Luteibaculaceae bacterium]
MSFESLAKDIKQKKFEPVYFFCGEETFYIDTLVDLIIDNVLQPHEKDFNESIFYGRDAECSDVINTAKRFPMMADKQLVLVKEAHDLGNFEMLEGYLKNPVQSTVLVFAYKKGKPDGRKPIFKLFSTLHAKGYLETKKMYDNQLPKWIEEYVQQKGLKIESQSALLLAEFLGNDLSKIANEVDKLCINMAQGNTINNKIIEENIGISKDFNVFELQEALGAKDVEKVFRIVNYMGANSKKNPMIGTLAALHGFFSKILAFYYLPDKTKTGVATALKMHPFAAQKVVENARAFNAKKVLQILNLIQEYDLKCKGVDSANASEADLLKELCYKILN